MPITKQTSRESKDSLNQPPKKPLSAFFIFSIENRERVKNEFPNAKFVELSKILGAEWQKMSDAKRKIYQDKAEILKKEYSKKKAEYELNSI